MAKAPENSVVLSYDEKGQTAIKQYGGQSFCFRGYSHIPYGQKVRGICDLFAARNVHSKKMHHKFYDWKNSFIVIDFLQELLKVYPEKDIYIIWDGWSAHTFGAIKAFLDLTPRIKIAPLPTRASWLNPIERDFGLIQRFVLNNSNFETMKETMEAITDYITKELSSN
ncbi:MAG: transposase [Nanoarchaeota archaeon]